MVFLSRLFLGVNETPGQNIHPHSARKCAATGKPFTIQRFTIGKMNVFVQSISSENPPRQNWKTLS
jgi:hypothetical protein